MTTATVRQKGAAPAAVALARRFQALSDEKRVRILELLRAGEHCVCDLMDALDVGQSLLSFHLKTLKDAGLVSDRRQGRWSYYSLVPGALAELEDVLGALRSDAETCAEDDTGTCCA